MLNGALGLGFLFTAKDLASTAFDKLKKKLLDLEVQAGGSGDRIKKHFRQIGLGLAIVTAGIVGLGASFALASKAGEFEAAIAKVGAISGATGADLQALHDAAIQAGIATQFSPTEAAAGLQSLASLGYTAKESIQLLIPTLDLAAGSLGKLSVDGAAGLAGQALKAFGKDAGEAGLVVDQLLATVNSFAYEADELPGALGIASRGAIAAKQSFSDTLVALGLVKNVVPGVERGATAVAVAMERLANTTTQRMLQSVGVAALDAQGGFRPLLDVIQDLTPALAKMSDSRRAKFLIDAFGEHALAGISAIMAQVTNGITTATGEIVKGADAIKYLRGQMEGAGGTAAKFREQMLSTFEGQKKLLKGSLETLAITLGEPFVAVFKPIVGAVVSGINSIIAVVQKTPPWLKKLVAGLVVGGSALLVLVGGAFAAKAAIYVLGLAFRALLPALIPVAILAAKIALVMALIAGAAYLVKKAYAINFGGIADFVDGVWRKTRLFFQALVQVFRDGGFSGAVMDELGRAENGGLKRFVIGLYMFWHRLEAVWAGIKEGFEVVWKDLVQPALDDVRRSFDRLGGTITDIGRAFGMTASQVTRATTERMLPASQRFKEVGEGIGGTLADMTIGVIRLFGWVVDLANAVGELVRALQDLGEWLGTTAGQIVLNFQGKGAVSTFKDLAAKAIGQAEITSGVSLVPHLAGVFPKITPVFDAGASLASEPTGLQISLSPSAMPAATQAALATLPAVSQVDATAAAVAERTGGASGGSAADVVGALQQNGREVSSAVRQLASRPVLVQVDGETVARAVHSANDKAAARSFSGVPVY